MRSSVRSRLAPPNLSMTCRLFEPFGTSKKTALLDDTFSVGNHSFPLPLDIGTSRSPQYETDPNILAGLNELQLPTLPVFELVCTQGPLAGNTYYTSDPGKALITGQCSDIGRGKGLILRGLSARAPYFHNGVAANLRQLVNFYNQRFQIDLSEQQMRDLVTFLQTL